MPTWNTIPSKIVNGAIPSADWNTYVQGNQNYLAARPMKHTVYQNTGADYSLTATTWTDVDASNLTLTLVTQVSSARVILEATFVATIAGGALNCFFDWYEGSTASNLTESGTAIGSNGVTSIINTSRQNIYVKAIFANVTPGSHTYTLRYKCGAGATLTLTRSSFPIMLHAEEC